jgi:hypothetical protein
MRGLVIAGFQIIRRDPFGTRLQELGIVDSRIAAKH